jgi:hypothetical protein
VPGLQLTSQNLFRKFLWKEFFKVGLGCIFLDVDPIIPWSLWHHLIQLDRVRFEELTVKKFYSSFPSEMLYTFLVFPVRAFRCVVPQNLLMSEAHCDITVFHGPSPTQTTSWWTNTCRLPRLLIQVWRPSHLSATEKHSVRVARDTHSGKYAAMATVTFSWSGRSLHSHCVRVLSIGLALALCQYLLCKCLLKVAGFFNNNNPTLL